MRSDTAEIRVPCFSIEIDTFDWWKKAKVAWLAPKETPEALLDLVTKLGGLIRAHSINIDDWPYRPHMMVARKVSSKFQSTKFASIHWNINEFCFLESLTHSSSVEYKALETWPLLSS